MTSNPHSARGDFPLSMDELRVVAHYAVGAARDVLPVFERAVPGDPRPRAAIDAACCFVHGGRRTSLQRVASVAAHRAARAAPTDIARLAARAAGDAASAAYLHPIARASQVGHILRAAATAAHIAQLRAGGDPAVADAFLDRSRWRATPVLIDVLRRYPSPAGGSGRIAHLMTTLDRSLRRTPVPAPAGAQPRDDGAEASA
ncbi:putative immunity protein [Actinocatenispora comari]|uniref:Imm-5-like domain-containing protein n=1 Tax=Actinocatenispora comari TaxID=2807577 RepID=A0A8J4A7C3_9ACTN|nr:exonuclease SbcC [Actinocatenispora comari]GIL26264.1 hypothetical protein NUM_15180 [Actinocatenispora comari]